MGAGRAGHEGVGRVDRQAPPGEIGLIPSGPPGRLPVGGEEPERVEEPFGPPALLRAESAFDLGDVHARRRQHVALIQPAPKIRRDPRKVPEEPDQDRRIQEIDGQDASSVRRWACTHRLIEAWSSNSG